MKESTEFSGADSMAIIGKMIHTARNQMTENGHLYRLWGWVILACSIGHYLLQYVFNVQQFALVWMLTWVAAIYQIIYLVRKGKQVRVRTYMDDILKYVWLVFVILMFLVAVILTPALKHVGDINIAILILYGMPTFLSGKILQFKPLVIGGVICWVLALLSLVIPKQFVMLLLSAAVIAAWLIPGYLLQAKYKKQNAGI